MKHLIQTTLNRISTPIVSGEDEPDTDCSSCGHRSADSPRDTIWRCQRTRTGKTPVKEEEGGWSFMHGSYGHPLRMYTGDRARCDKGTNVPGARDAASPVGAAYRHSDKTTSHTRRSEWALLGLGRSPAKLEERALPRSIRNMEGKGEFASRPVGQNKGRCQVEEKEKPYSRKLGAVQIPRIGKCSSRHECIITGPLLHTGNLALEMIFGRRLKWLPISEQTKHSCVF